MTTMSKSKLKALAIEFAAALPPVDLDEGPRRSETPMPTASKEDVLHKLEQCRALADVLCSEINRSSDVEDGVMETLTFHLWEQLGEAISLADGAMP